MNDDDFAELFRLPQPPKGDTTWADVGREFENLGRTLSDTVRAALRPNEERVRELQDAFQVIMGDITHALDHGTATPEAERAREQVARLVDSIRGATERSSQELRPELIRLLRQANAELRRLSRTDS